MTAEIAIINRTAVTLAADSAMTLSGGQLDKIYNCADKIFELSTHDPIGVMIYNSLEFMGVPLDVIIKQFRDSSHCVGFDSLSAAASALFKFLQESIGASEESQSDRVKMLCTGVFATIRKSFEEKLEKIILQHPTKPPKGFDPMILFLESADRVLAPLRAIKKAGAFENLSHESFKERYLDALNAGISESWEEGWITKEGHDILREIGSLVFLKDFVTPMHTGVVIAGYGKKDIFPSVISFQVDGIVADRLKYRNGERVEIDRHRRTAAIVPFAQHDMADRFLYGIDPEVEANISEYFESTIRKVGVSIVSETPRSRAKRPLLEKLEKSITVAVQEFKEAGLREIKEQNKKLIQDMVSFMPKQELANFSESLVNITSIKRRVSAEQETVGGPIDVAVISRSDGFVWVKRKHYFDPSLNHRFFFRKYGMLSPSGLGGQS